MAGRLSWMWSAEELRGWVAASWPEWDWSAAVIEHGSFHQVVVSAGRVVARVAAGPGRRSPLCHDSARPDGERSGPVLHVGVLALGVADVQRAARFWCAALDYDVRTDGFGGWATVLVPRSGSGLKIALQRSETTPQDHPRLHLDLHAADAAEQATEADRLVSLGARRIDWDSYPEDPDFVVLADPEGNRFCMVDLGHHRL